MSQLRPETVDVNGITFASADRLNLCFKKLLKGDFGMLEHIQYRRNQMVIEMMQKASAEQAHDPLSDPSAEAQVKRPRKDMLDEIPQVLTVPIESTGKSIRILSAWHPRAKLAFELSKDNMELLASTYASHEEDPPFVPIISEPNVKWHTGKQSVCCKYQDQDKVKTKYMRPTLVDGSDKQQAVDRVAKACQQWYDALTPLEDSDADK